MKGKHILFLAIPAMMLASCGGNLGTEVTDSSAINDMLSNVATKSEVATSAQKSLIRRQSMTCSAMSPRRAKTSKTSNSSLI